MSKRVIAALVWLQRLLERQNVEYQIVGGLAATIYAGHREVADIDLYIPSADIDKILPDLTPYITKPLRHYTEGAWDLDYLQLIYQSQKIEIGLVPGTKIYSAQDNLWHSLVIDFSASVLCSYQGITVPVIPAAALIEYKRLLGREVDVLDINALEHNLAHK